MNVTFKDWVLCRLWFSFFRIAMFFVHMCNFFICQSKVNICSPKKQIFGRETGSLRLRVQSMAVTNSLHWVMRADLCRAQYPPEAVTHRSTFRIRSLSHLTLVYATDLTWQLSRFWTVVEQVDTFRLYFTLHLWWSSVQVDFLWACWRASKPHADCAVFVQWAAWVHQVRWEWVIHIDTSVVSWDRKIFLLYCYRVYM